MANSISNDDLETIKAWLQAEKADRVEVNPSLVKSLIARIEQQIEEIDTMREALSPFAYAADHVPPKKRQYKGSIWATFDEDTQTAHRITVADLDRAASIVGETRGH